MATSTQTEISWPKKFDLFGIQVSALTCDEACNAVIEAAQRREPAVVSAFAVHALIESSTLPSLGRKVNRFAIILPDGQPIKWALNWLYGTRLETTVQGYELMQALCQRCAEEGLSIYLYGSSPETLAALEANLAAAYPGLQFAGVESPPFRPLTAEEDAEMVERVNASGAAIMFLGLGCPKQDHFAGDHADKIEAIQFSVGAAFDFLAGTKPPAPAWLQTRGLAWVFRLYHEPRRLWKRYMVTNSIFLKRLAGQFIRQRILGRVPSSSTLSNAEELS